MSIIFRSYPMGRLDRCISSSERALINARSETVTALISKVSIHRFVPVNHKSSLH